MTIVRTCSCSLLMALALEAHAVEDGVYEMDAHGEPGRRVVLPVTRGQIRAEDNANNHWSGFICYPSQGFLEGNRYGVVLAGAVRRIAGWGASGVAENHFSVALTADEVERARALFGLPVQPRHHPGHRIDGVFATAKPVYMPGERIIVTLVIRNHSDQPFRFQAGGHQRGPRNDQFHFAGQGPAGCLMIKAAVNFGGMSTVITIPPRGETAVSADLDAWIGHDQPGHYALMASYLLPIHEDDQGFPIWVDYMTRPLAFEVGTPPAE